MEFPLVKRGLAGLLLGSWVGALYGLVSANVNIIFIRDVPLHFDLNAMIATVGWSLLAGAVLGLIVNIPDNALLGVVLASLASAIGIAVQGVLNTAYAVEKLFSTLFLMTYTFLPLIILFVPFNALLRWSSQQILLKADRPGWNSPRLRSVALWTLLAVLVGSFSLYPANARKMLLKMDGFIRIAQSEPGKNLPYEFSQVVPAIRSASPQYGLAWTDDTSVYPELLLYEDSLMTFRLQVVSAHFQSGEVIFCLFREVDANLYLCSAGNLRQ